MTGVCREEYAAALSCPQLEELVSLIVSEPDAGPGGRLDLSNIRAELAVVMCSQLLFSRAGGKKGSGRFSNLAVSESWE